ncbi:hypothetical protein, partial [Porphyromonas gingivalis]|uniref:hypothetical protein n=1 Tax=Porphyromonas gingivalis TaxID=837 RepID=UPI0015CF7310
MMDFHLGAWAAALFDFRPVENALSDFELSAFFSIFVFLQFAQPEDQTRREDDENPVHRGKGYYAEHASAKSRDDDLSYK